MFSFALAFFLPHIHSLTLVSDPDSILTDEGILAELGVRGFTVIREIDPVLLRRRIEQAKPFSLARPVIVITPGVLEDLPYDLWQAGHRVTLSLHDTFPNLSYPLLRALTSNQRARLGTATQPTAPFGPNATLEYILRHVFDFDIAALEQPALLVQWLIHLHQDGLAPLPPPLRDDLLARLGRNGPYQGWPLPALLDNASALNDFLQTQWAHSLQRITGQQLSETAAPYLLRFETDPVLQDSLAGMVRTGMVAPVTLDEVFRIPSWAVAAVAVSTQDARPQLAASLLETIQSQLNNLSTDSRWTDWQTIARRWAELTAIWHGELSGSPELAPRHSGFHDVQAKLDSTFIGWLQRSYAPLGSQKLPVPHHVHHIPTYLKYHDDGKVALLVMDGMSLSDWIQISRVWKRRNPNWQFSESLLLAQIPTITALSRYALVSGLRPADFYDPSRSLPTESRPWRNFWMREGLPENAAFYQPLALTNEALPAEISGSRLKALCLVDRTIDDMMHGATLGAANLNAALRLWLERDQPGQNGSARLERQIACLLEQGFTVFISSDHGHCESVGIGSPSEGLAAQTRGKRARLYQDVRAACLVQDQFENTVLWQDDGILPGNLTSLMPTRREAFTALGEVVVTHGGLTIDEVIVPFVKICAAK